jgi:hypothetical protein
MLWWCALVRRRCSSFSCRSDLGVAVGLHLGDVVPPPPFDLRDLVVRDFDRR